MLSFATYLQNSNGLPKATVIHVIPISKTIGISISDIPFYNIYHGDFCLVDLSTVPGRCFGKYKNSELYVYKFSIKSEFAIDLIKVKKILYAIDVFHVREVEEFPEYIFFNSAQDISYKLHGIEANFQGIKFEKIR